MSNFESEPGPVDPDSIDSLYEVLSHPRRRRALALLAAHGRPLTLHDLAKELAIREQDAPLTEIPGERLTRIATSLHHCHLPKIAESDVITYDRDRQIAEPTETLDQIEPDLTSVEEAVASEVTPGSRC